ncbi:hypothetical protein ACROYT_G014557 [Oculina patagonica]
MVVTGSQKKKTDKKVKYSEECPLVPSILVNFLPNVENSSDVIFSRAERKAHYANCLKAELNPEQYLSLIIDGMDQAKTNIPHANCLSKRLTVVVAMAIRAMANTNNLPYPIQETGNQNLDAPVGYIVVVLLKAIRQIAKLHGRPKPYGPSRPLQFLCFAAAAMAASKTH